MKEKIMSILGFGGLGMTLSFFLIVLLYPSYTAMEKLMPIYLAGMLLGCMLGIFKAKLNASGYAFILGFSITAMLYLIWLHFPFTMAYSFAFLALVVFVMWIVESTSTLDIAIVPFAYFGGFILASLVFRNVEMHKIEGSIMSIVLVGVAGAGVSLIMSLFKAFMETAQAFRKKI
ncbi:hypothetical protein E3E31_11325 [Thermococcus sp. M39]|uniref:hypothetical protein n=1 Tax=unclassified Thermococcus TaxID=2627626 RepID=UPI001439E5CE|nr:MULTISPECIES: hypothetical protein [unclassified Thermococcus]NJE09103.1 hypothetical protein [Thermococcus sp. M39]NJE12052.1 hypothetical protein [Thermococcus sp. LS2]